MHGPALPITNRVAILLVLFIPALASANPPVASYIFPAGGQRGTTFNVRVGGLFDSAIPNA